jgi:hypothetical protein
MTPSLLDEFFEHLVFGEEVMAKSISRRNPFLGVFFEEFFHEVEP